MNLRKNFITKSQTLERCLRWMETENSFSSGLIIILSIAILKQPMFFAKWQQTIPTLVFFTLLMFKFQELVFLTEWCKWIIDIESNDKLYGDSGNMSFSSYSSMYVRSSMSILIGSGDIGDSGYVVKVNVFCQAMMEWWYINNRIITTKKQIEYQYDWMFFRRKHWRNIESDF